MSIADQIYRIKRAKTAIKEAIQNKGVSVSDTAKLDDYPALINSIVAGDSDDYWPDFWETRTRTVSSCQYLFAYMEIKEVETRYRELIENYNTSKYVSYSNTFFNFCNTTASGYLTELDLTKWDTSKGVSFGNMFTDCKLNYLDISGWDFSSVMTTSGGMSLFMNTRIKEVNMSNCNISKATSYYRFAYGASELVTINMTGCDTSAMTSASGMFYNCTKLTEIIGEIDGSNLTDGFYSSSAPFYNCTSLETLYLKNIYKDCTITNANKFGINLEKTKVKDECLVYIIDQLPNLADKGITNNTAIKLTLPTTNTLTDEQKQIARDKGWIVVN